MQNQKVDSGKGGMKTEFTALCCKFYFYIEKNGDDQIFLYFV
jgi:hypothetical protein